MSLKPFHIVLITAAILLGLGVGWWGIDRYATSGEMVHLRTGLIAFGGSIALLVYLFWFLKKMKSKGW